MKEYGVIFSGPMVRAILEGHKTLTRRPVKIKDSPGTKPWYPVGNHFTPTQLEKYRVYPRWHVGDQIWMRETWAVGLCVDPHSPSELDPGDWLGYYGGLWYPSDNTIPDYPNSIRGRTRVPLSMPRWASRFTGDVSRTWIERLQDITEEDAQAEGAELHQWTNARTYRESFSMFWDSQHGKKPGLSWADNPWILGTEFRGVK